MNNDRYKGFYIWKQKDAAGKTYFELGKNGTEHHYTTESRKEAEAKIDKLDLEIKLTEQI